MQTSPLATHRSLLQTANPALAAKRQAAAKPEFTGPKARTGDFVVLSRAALAQSRAPAAQNAPNSQATEPTGKDATPTAPLAPAVTVPRGLPPTYGQLDLDAIRQHFGTNSGDENFYAGADADRNGVVDFRDMTHVLANWGQTRS